MKKKGMLSDDRQIYSIGGIIKTLLNAVKSKKKPSDIKTSEDIDKLIAKLSDEDYDKLSAIEKEQLLDLQLEKYDVDMNRVKSTKKAKDIDDILDDLTDEEIAKLSPLEKEQLLDLEIEKFGVDGRNKKAHGGGALPNEGLEALHKKEPELVARMMARDGGSMDDQMMMVMDIKPMESDNEMEDNYTRFIMEEALSEDEEDMLLSKLEQDEELQMLFDKVIDVAQEFAGSGPVEGPGSGVSDSIPAR